MQGGSVLFACFNKTLATDIRRLVSLSPNINHVKKTFEVKDIFDIANVYGEILNLDPYDEDNTHDDWGDLIVQALAEGDLSTYRKFDTILIDEAQDMTEWQLELLRLHSNFDSSIWIAVGKELKVSYCISHKK